MSGVEQSMGVAMIGMCTHVEFSDHYLETKTLPLNARHSIAWAPLSEQVYIPRLATKSQPLISSLTPSDHNGFY